MEQPRVDMVDITRQIKYFLPPSTSEISLSSRSSLSTAETPPASPLKPPTEPMYENAQEAFAAFYDVIPSTSQQVAFDCNRLKDQLQEFAKQKPLSPIYEKALLDIPQSALSRSSSASNTVSVSAAVSDESVAGDSGVFEASRATNQIKETAQIQVTLKYLSEESALLITIERARNLTVLALPAGCQLYIKAILLPSTSGNSVVLRTKTFNEFMKPVFGASVQIPIALSKVYTKSLQIKIMMLLSQKEDWVVRIIIVILYANKELIALINATIFFFLRKQGSAQISLAEFSTQQDGNCRWYNVISRENMNESEVEESVNAAKEESSDESTVISSQTSTLTRNQGMRHIFFSSHLRASFNLKQFYY
jgi:protein KIBRA